MRVLLVNIYIASISNKICKHLDCVLKRSLSIFLFFILNAENANGTCTVFLSEENKIFKLLLQQQYALVTKKYQIVENGMK